MTPTDLTRRNLLGAGLALTTAPLLPGQALAKAGYRFTEGAFDITVLSDGYISVPGEILVPDGAGADRAAVLGQIDAPGGVVHAPCNIPLIRTGQDLILVDIGSGRKYQTSDGRMTENLMAAGIDPAAITRVVFTHAHPDHIWATLADTGGLRFPNASYHVGAAEWDFWTSPDFFTTMPAALHDFARGTQRDLAALRDRAVMLRPGDDVVTGLRVLDTAGHTPGHLSLELGGPQGLLIAGDVAVNERISFAHPDWPFGYDTLPEVAIRTRRRLIDRAATDRIRLLGYHWQYPGIGHAERRGQAFHFVPEA
ncbi:MBL fold metallo-hydrolase [bacterium]|nr:MBL fold metallo-hydrolase [bacterium]